MHTEAPLTTLRGLLYEEPAAASWDEICHTFDRLEGDAEGLEVALEYAQAHLSRWPDALRLVPARWRGALEQDRPCPAVAITRALELGALGGGPGRARVLARQPALAPLTILRLNNNHLGDEGALALFQSPHLQGLRALDLGVNRVTDEAPLALAREGALPRLETLDLTYNKIGQAFAQALVKHEALGSLRELRLWHNQLGPKGAAALCEAEHLRALEALDLGSNALLDQGARALAAAIPGRFPALRRLNLSGNGLSAEVVDALTRDPKLRHLDMNLSGNARVTTHP